MEEILEDYSTAEDIKKFENIYNYSLQTGTVTRQQQFDYAWSLIRSKYSTDIRRGVILLEDLFQRGEESSKRDCLYYLAIGNTKLMDYSRAMDLISKFLSVEPTNRQAIELQKIIKSKMRKDGIRGIAMIGGAAAVVGGLVTLGIALSKGRN